MPSKVFEEPIKAKNCLDFKKMFYLICCCCKTKKYREYNDALNKIDGDIDSSLDLLNMLRRLRSHGFALSLLLNSGTIRLISRRA